MTWSETFTLTYYTTALGNCVILDIKSKILNICPTMESGVVWCCRTFVITETGADIRR